MFVKNMDICKYRSLPVLQIDYKSYIIISTNTFYEFLKDFNGEYLCFCYTNDSVRLTDSKNDNIVIPHDTYYLPEKFEGIKKFVIERYTFASAISIARQLSTDIQFCFDCKFKSSYSLKFNCGRNGFIIILGSMIDES